MQIVKYGKKQRQVRVPVGWVFVKDGQKIQSGDKVFNLYTHGWDNATSDDEGDLVGPDDVCVVIREERRATPNTVDKDSHAVRIVPEI